MSNYFTALELACQHCGESNFDTDFLALLNSIREECNFPFIVTSAYRCDEHPLEARKERLGEHTTGKAIDIAAEHDKALKLLEGLKEEEQWKIIVEELGIVRAVENGHLLYMLRTVEDDFSSFLKEKGLQYD